MKQINGSKLFVLLKKLKQFYKKRKILTLDIYRHFSEKL